MKLEGHLIADGVKNLVDLRKNMSLDTTTAYLLLGSNLGERERYLDRAVEMIAATTGAIVALSGIYETAAWGKEDQPGFLNRAVAINTGLSAIALLRQVLTIEKMLGRVREEKWGARFIDIDIILYGSSTVNIDGELYIPHPQMQNRRFVMEPLVEIAPDVLHPVFQKSMQQILADLDDPLAVNKLA